jgi:hypothetical protein
MPVLQRDAAFAGPRSGAADEAPVIPGSAGIFAPA